MRNISVVLDLAQIVIDVITDVITHYSLSLLLMLWKNKFSFLKDF